MNRYLVLYNPLSGGGSGKEAALRLPDLLPDCELRFYDVTEIDGFSSFLAQADPRSAILLAGGDGTLAHFANEVPYATREHDVYYYATGISNDFWRDVGRRPGDPPIRVNRYLDRMPMIRTERETVRMLNGVSCGALCAAQVGSTEYFDVTVTVDGTVHHYEKVLMATVSHGKFCNGLMTAPSQNRLKGSDELTVTILHGVGRFGAAKLLRTLRIGKYKRELPGVSVLVGRQISLATSAEVAICSDGERCAQAPAVRSVPVRLSFPLLQVERTV